MNNQSDVIFRERQFSKFDRARKGAGFTRQVPTQTDIRSRITVDVSAAVAGQNKYTFFTDISESSRALKTQDPFIDRAGNLEREVLVGVYGLSLVPDAAGALTVTELNEAARKLGIGDFELKAGQDFITQLYAGKLLQAPTGYAVTNDGATTPLAARRQMEPLVEWTLPKLVILNPGVKVQAELFTDGTFTGTTNFTLDVILHSFVARQ